MKFPNKINSYKESTISKFPIILKKVSVQDYNVLDLYKEVKSKMTIKEFEDSLVCLFALNKIILYGEVIHYVG